MSQIEKSLNKLKIISETLSSIPTFADSYWQNDNRVYKTKLQQFSFQISNDILPINKTRLEKTLLKWNDFINNSIDKKSFTLKEIEILSFQSELILNQKYWDLLIDAETISPKTIIGLLYSLYDKWSCIENLDSVISIAQNLIYNYKGDNKIVNTWKTSLKNILSTDTPMILAKECLNSGISINEIYKKYYLNIDNTDLNNIVQEKYLEAKLSEYVTNRNIKVNDVRIITNNIEQSTIYKNQSNKYYALIIKAVENTQTEKNQSKEFLKEYFINNINYKDPRNNFEKWLNFDNEAKQMFISWLNEEDIRLFFDVFIDYDPHGRKEFWLRYAKYVRTTQIVQNPNLSQNIENQQKIQGLINKGISFPKLIDAKTNAFIMEFDNFTIVEFSEISNACYIYDKNKLKYYQKIKNSFYIGELKDRQNAIITITHNKNWQFNLKNWLADKGIR